MSDRRRVLVAARDDATRRDVSTCLRAFETIEASDEIMTAALCAACRPDLIVIDARDEPAAEVVAVLRKDFRTTLTPIVHIVDRAGVPSMIGGSVSASDDYVVPPLDAELAERVDFALRRSDALRGINPLTGLPGNAVVRAQIERRLAEAHPFACLYIDVDKFKAFNDRYGFVRGDDLICAVAECIVGVLAPQPAGECFAGHVGGDDFVVLTPMEGAEAVAGSITRSFDETVAALPDSTGVCSMSIGIVHAGPDTRDAADLAEMAAETKGVAKRRAGSAWAVGGARS